MTMSMMAGDVFPCFEEILEHSDVEPADPSERPSGEAGHRRMWSGWPSHRWPKIPLEGMIDGIPNTME